jgi:hypothetical protein
LLVQGPLELHGQSGAGAESDDALQASVDEQASVDKQASSDEPEESSDELLISGRIETIYLHSLTGRIRENFEEHSRFYFNNIFLNLEGDLGPRAEFTVEYQPLTSDLYLLGGFLTIAESLEGIGSDDEDADPRILEIDRIVTESIEELDAASEKGHFERAAVNFYISDNFGVKLGRVRNPFGFWDDFSLFRNLSALKTDPVTLGVALRRADLGFTVFGNAGRFAYETGVLQGGSTFTNKDVNDFKDVVLKVGTGWSRLDLAGNVYFHDVGRDAEPTVAWGLSYRYRMTYDFTMLGEFILMDNDHLGVETRGFYVQGNYDLSESWVDGLRWNTFFEVYDSSLLDADLDETNYRFAGTYLQSSTELIYAYNRSIDLGAKLLGGADEEGSPFFKVALKMDAQF